MNPSALNPVDIEWWGTAAFRIRVHGPGGLRTLLLDPYLTRSPHSTPAVRTSLDDASNADAILLSHGHFDHVQDVPELLIRNPELKVYGGATSIRTIRRLLANRGFKTTAEWNLHEVGDTLLDLGLPPEERKAVSVCSARSKHVHFDTGLVKTTLARTLRSPFRKYARFQLLTQYPCGETLAYFIDLSGFRILFLGSAGPTDAMLREWSRFAIDCLLVPLQGNSRICAIGANIVEKLRPRVVIPHHHDDFYPPISQTVNIEPFRERLAQSCPDTAILELEVDRPFRLVEGQNETRALRIARKIVLDRPISGLSTT